MNKKFFLVLILFITLQLGFAQMSVYHPFSNKTLWIESCGGLGGCGSTCCSTTSAVCVFQRDQQYFLGPDTLIGSQIYNTVYYSMSEMDYYSGPTSCPPGCSAGPWYYSLNNIYTGAIRQDTLLRKVYFMPVGETYDSLLYDFSLNLGDTLPPTYQTAGTLDSNYVTKIDSVLVGTNYHNRFWLTPINYWAASTLDTNYIAIIEGIGSTFGLFSELRPIFENSCNLNCVYLDSIPVYPDTATSCSSLITMVLENEIKLISSIIPNPFNSFASIHFNLPLENAELSLYNLFGVKVRTTKSISGKEITIFREGLPAGIYFIRVIQNDKVITINKLLIND